jgi:hypothetical protein
VSAWLLEMKARYLNEAGPPWLSQTILD